MNKRRRKLLVAGSSLGAVGLSGCLRRAGGVVRGIRETFYDEEGTPRTEGNPSDENEPETIPLSETNDNNNIPSVTINTDIEIDPGSVYYWEFTNLDSTNKSSYTLEYDVIVRSGQKVNAVFMDHNELDIFLNYDNIRYYEDKSRLESTHAVVNTEIRPQDYAFVVENTSMLEETTANVNLEIR